MVFANAAKEGGHLVGFLDHPLRMEGMEKEGKKINSCYTELSLQNKRLFERSSSAKADGIQTVASQQTHCL